MTTMKLRAALVMVVIAVTLTVFTSLENSSGPGKLTPSVHLLAIG